MLDTLVRVRRDLHKIPETGFELALTQKYVLGELKKTRAEITELTPSGVLAYFDFGADETFAFRADMDALPVKEMTGAPYASERDGFMHACGHDGHMAILLALAKALNERPTEGKRNALLIFQPAEELGTGAETVVNTKSIQKYNPKEIYALHVEPSLPIGAISTRSGGFMARSAEVRCHIYGESAHVARAHLGVDATECAARFYIEAVDLIEGKYKDVPHIFKMGVFKSGVANNVLSDYAYLFGALRALDNDVFSDMKTDIFSVASSVSQRFSCRIKVDISGGCPPVINDARCFERFSRAVDGLNFAVKPEPHMTSEDFARYSEIAPSLLFNIGLSISTTLHANDFDFDERALLTGLDVFMRLFDS